MKTFFFDLDDTIIDLNWKVFEKAYYGGLAEAFSHIMKKEEIVENIYLSYLYMVENNDSRTNRDKFYDKLEELSGVNRQIMIAAEPNYYNGPYEKLRELTTTNQAMVESVKLLAKQGYPLILASQPVFPAIATLRRLSWCGLEKELFMKITSYETEYSCKPHLKYYQDLLTEFSLVADDCVMVGNDRDEDMIATKLGIRGILITDCLIDSDSEYNCEEMTSREFLAYVRNL